jgi:hypothetical protein
MVPQRKRGETVLTGLLEDRSAVFGALGQIEALGLDLLELRQMRARPTECTDVGAYKPPPRIELGRTSQQPT